MGVKVESERHTMIASAPIVRHGCHMTETIGNRVKTARLAKGLAQADLATAAGLRQLAISQIENDHVTDPKGSTVVSIADALGVPVEWLLRGDQKRPEGDTPDLPPYRTYREFVESPASKTATADELAWLRSLRLPDGMEPGDRFYLMLLMLFRSETLGERRGARSA